jgi:putative oxidoreductase
LFGGFFLYSGINHFRQRKHLAQYAQAKKAPMAELSVIASGVALTVGGASILLGVKAKVGSLAIPGFLAGVSPVMDDFWRAEDPNQRTHDMINFMKNLALAGAALALMGVEEPWPGECTRCAAKHREPGQEVRSPQSDCGLRSAEEKLTRVVLQKSDSPILILGLRQFSRYALFRET